MFGVSVKNPLEAETVGQRRERKAKVSEGSVCSRSGSRKRFETRSIKSNKFNIFGAFDRASRYSNTSLDGPLEISVKQEFEVCPSELPASSQLSHPTTLLDAPWRSERGISELSGSPSVCKPRAPKLSPTPPLALSEESFEKSRQDVSSVESIKLVENYGKVEPHVENKSDDIIVPVEPEQSFPSPTLLHRRNWSCSERHDVSRHPSGLSSRSTSRSETFSIAKTTSKHGQFNRTNLHSTNVSYKVAKQDYVDTPDTTVSTEPDMDSIPAVSPLLLQPMFESVPEPPAQAPRQNEPPTQDTPPIPRQIIPIEDITPYKMRLMQIASNKIYYSRLTEDWHGVETQLRRFVDLEQKLWALSGLKRLTESISSEAKTEFMVELPSTGQQLPSADERRQVLHISDDAVESCAQAITRHDCKIQLLYPMLLKSSYDLPWQFPHGVSGYRWPEIPTLPYRSSSMHEIASRALPLILTSSQWPHFLRECRRVLNPGGVLSITVQDPMPRKCGPLLRQWTMDYLVLGLEKRFLATHPGMIVPVWMNEAAGFEREEAEVFAYSAVVGVEVLGIRGPACDGERDDKSFTEPLRTVVGRHFYEALYSGLMPEVSPQRTDSGARDGSQSRGWWWEDSAILQECKELRTVFEMVTYRYRKRDGTDKRRPEVK